MGTPSIHLYVMPSMDVDEHGRWLNFGTAPCLTGGLITLSNCGQVARKRAEVGDTIIGVSPKPLGPARIVHFIEIEEKISFSEAWKRGHEDERFLRRRGGVESPREQTDWVFEWQQALIYDGVNGEDLDPPGDIMVKPSGDDYHHIDGAVHGHKEEWRSNLKGKGASSYIVGSSKSTYFGQGPLLADSMLEVIARAYPNYEIDEFHPLGTPALGARSLSQEDAREFRLLVEGAVAEFNGTTGRARGSRQSRRKGGCH